MHLLRRRKRVEFEVSAATFEALILGALAGMRSMAVPALLSRAVRRGDVEGLAGTPLALLGSEKLSTALRFLMVGEIIADKFPFAPDRTFAPALAWRLFSGGLAGATVFASEGRHRNSGAVLGALSALATSYAGEHARKTEAGETALSNAALGALEDWIVLALGPPLLGRKKP